MPVSPSPAASTSVGSADAETESRAILERLGVLATPLVPLPWTFGAVSGELDRSAAG